MYVVLGLVETLLGGPAVNALNLLSKIDTITSDSHQYKNLSQCVHRPSEIEAYLQDSNAQDNITVLNHHS